MTNSRKHNRDNKLPNGDNYRLYPALAGYIDRIAAELEAEVDQRSFKRFGLVRREGKYNKDQTVVAFAADGSVTVRDNNDDAAPKLMPTKEEAEALKAEFVRRDFPSSVHASEARTRQQRSKLGISSDSWFEIRSQRDRSEIIMCRQRIDKEDGGKAYTPWTYFSDGHWRNMEPDSDLLPLWKPEKRRSKYGSRLMIHEGEKKARFVDGLVNDIMRRAELKAHPWAAWLVGFEHWGWISGAPNPNRTGWSELLAENPTEIVVVADNDQVGIDAIPRISRALLRPMKVITFKDHGFPPSFDLADDWPRQPKWWDKDGQRYVGPTFDDCLESATWATDKIQPTGKGPPTYRIRPQFAAEWVVVIGLAEPLFIHRDQTYQKLSEKAFNVAVKPFSHVENPARYLKSSFSSQVKGITYNPAHPPEVINVTGENQINTFRPPIIKAIDGDVAPFTDFMEHLIPIESDRIEVERWVATFIARPDIRMLYAILLISETQGVGKSTLGYILALLAGLWNTSYPSEEAIVGSNYNPWVAHKRLAVVNEIYAGHSWRAYNKLKDEITEPHVDVSEKYLPSYRIDNWLHIFACSNSMHALRVDDDDRRWLIPKVTENLKKKSYWTNLYAWLRVDGLGIIKWWASDFLKTHNPVEQGEHAPDTMMKRQVIAEGRSDGEKTAYDLGVHIAGLARDKDDDGKPQTPRKIIIDIPDVRDLVATRRGIKKTGVDNQYLEKPARLRKMLVAGGLLESYRNANGERQRFTIDRKSTEIVANFPIEEGAAWADLKEHHLTLKTLVPSWWTSLF
jgi:hypothetical protein